MPLDVLAQHYPHPFNPVHVYGSKPCALKNIAVHLAMAMGLHVRPCSDITTDLGPRIPPPPAFRLEGGPALQPQRLDYCRPLAPLQRVCYVGRGAGGLRDVVHQQCCLRLQSSKK